MADEGRSPRAIRRQISGAPAGGARGRHDQHRGSRGPARPALRLRKRARLWLWALHAGRSQPRLATRESRGRRRPISSEWRPT